MKLSELMEAPAVTPDLMVAAALDALRARDEASLDALPAPLYTTDAEGRLTYYNRACIAFSGRTPSVGEDKWCVTWKLYTAKGDYLPHEECPMAVAVREKKPVRGVEAVAERPDGTRVSFRPYPTPLFDEEGNFLGAINLFEDLTVEKQAEYLRAQAKRCRRFARSVSDERTARTLAGMAEDYEGKASELRPLD